MQQSILAVRVLAASAALCLATAALTPARAQDKARERTVSLAAQGRVSVEPDLAIIQTGVVSDAATAREAMTANTQAMRRVIDTLKASGVEARDIRTTAVNLQPRYQTQSPGSKAGQAPAIVGYSVRNSVSVTVRNLAQLGVTLDQLVSAGANQLGGIVFDVSRAEQLKDEARKAAMAEATRKARLYAATIAGDLGPVLSISEDAAMPYPRPVAMGRATMSAEAVPIEAGAKELVVTVQVTWELK